MGRKLITFEELKKVLHYCKETGRWTWLTSMGARGAVGSQAGSYNTLTGYNNIKVKGRLYIASRLAYFWVNGEWPAGDMDHINGVKADDRWVNLRCVSTRVNTQNQRQARSDSQCGLLGAFWDTKRQRWYSKITLGYGRKKWLGTFPDATSAHSAYVKAKRQHHEGCTI